MGLTITPLAYAVDGGFYKPEKSLAMKGASALLLIFSILELKRRQAVALPEPQERAVVQEPPEIKLPDQEDYYSSVDKGWVSPVKDMGHKCNASTAFATNAVIETCVKRISGHFLDYSEQFLLDCAVGYEHGAFGCWGAQSRIYLQWASKVVRVLPLEKDYPYKNLNSTDKHLCQHALVKPDDTAYVFAAFDTQNGSEWLLRSAVQTYGAAVASIYYGNETEQRLTAYNGTGVFNCTPTDGDKSSTIHHHHVAVVGYGVEKESGSKYWLLKGNWGTEWGDQGYLRLRRDSRACGIGRSFATVECRLPADCTKDGQGDKDSCEKYPGPIEE